MVRGRPENGPRQRLPMILIARRWDGRGLPAFPRASQRMPGPRRHD